MMSEFGVSAMLSQHDDEGQDSGSSCRENSIIPPPEMNALIAIKLGVRAFQVYLLAQQFTVQTEHCALRWLD